MNNQFADNSFYVHCECFLEELSPLMAEGKGNTDKAGAVRDQMDGPWYRLSREEIEHIFGASTSLKEQPSAP